MFILLNHLGECRGQYANNPWGQRLLSPNRVLPLVLMLGLVLVCSFGGNVIAAYSFTNTPAIGVLAPPEEEEGLSLRQGAELGVSQANEAHDTHFRLVIRGRRGQWGDDGMEAGQLVLDDGARGLITPPGGVPTHLMMQISGRTAMPVVSLCPDSSATGAGVPWMVSVAPSTTDESGILFTSIVNRATGQYLKWGAFVPDGRAGREIIRDLSMSAASSGCPLIRIIELSAALTNLVDGKRRMMELKPEAILVWLPPASAGRIVSELRSSGYSGLLAGPSRLQSPVFLRRAGKAAENLVIPTIVNDKAGEALREKFVSAYRQRYWIEPDNTALLAYDAAALLANVLRNSPDAPHQVFPLAKDFAGASGRLKFSKNGSRQVELVLMGCREGRFMLSKTP